MEFLLRKNLFVMIEVWWLVSMLDRTEYQSLSSELLLIEKLKGKNLANCRKPLESYVLFSFEILRKNSEFDSDGVNKRRRVVGVPENNASIVYPFSIAVNRHKFMRI